MSGLLPAVLLAGTLVVVPLAGGGAADGPADLADPDVAAVGAAMLFDAAALPRVTEESGPLAGADDIGPAWAVWSFSDDFLTGGSFDPGDLKAGAIVFTDRWRSALVAGGVPVGTVEAALGPDEAMVLSGYDTDAGVAAGLAVPGAGHLVVGPRDGEAFFVVDGTVRPLNEAARVRFDGDVSLTEAQAVFVADHASGAGAAERFWNANPWRWVVLVLLGLGSSVAVVTMRRRESR